MREVLLNNLAHSIHEDMPVITVEWVSGDLCIWLSGQSGLIRITPTSYEEADGGVFTPVEVDTSTLKYLYAEVIVYSLDPILHPYRAILKGLLRDPYKITDKVKLVKGALEANHTGGWRSFNCFSDHVSTALIRYLQSGRTVDDVLVLLADLKLIP